MRLKDKVVLVTASTRGIGLASVKACSKEGAAVYMAARNMERARDIANTLDGVKCVYNDATKPETFTTMVEDVVREAGRIDVLKAAINYLTKLIAVHGAKHRIRCNAVLPGMTATEAVEKNLSNEFRSLFLRHIPLGRMGLPEEIASAVVYLASEEAAYTTGQILTVSGGFGLATPAYGDLAERSDRR